MRRIRTLTQLKKYTSRHQTARTPCGSRLAGDRIPDGTAPSWPPSLASQLLQKIGVDLAIGGLGADDPTALVIGRTPFADVFDMTEAAQADLLLIQPAHAAARRRDGRADVAVKRLRWADGC